MININSKGILSNKNNIYLFVTRSLYRNPPISMALSLVCCGRPQVQGYLSYQIPQIGTYNIEIIKV